MVIVCDLLDMFARDPQIGANEATCLINQIVNSITSTRTLEGVLVIVSFPFVGSAHHRNNTPAISYNDKTILPRFNKCIEIMNSHENRNNMTGIKIRNNIRRNKNTINDFHDHKISYSIKERDLLIAY